MACRPAQRKQSLESCSPDRGGEQQPTERGGDRCTLSHAAAQARAHAACVRTEHALPRRRL